MDIESKIISQEVIDRMQASETNLKPSAEAESASELLSRKAEVFRLKLLHQFHLLAAFDEAGVTDFKKIEEQTYKLNDVVDDSLAKGTLIDQPNGLIQFSTQTDRDPVTVTADDRRLNRIQNTYVMNPHMDIFAGWIVRSVYFKNFIVVVLVVNTIILGLQADLRTTNVPDAVMTALDVIDLLALLIFCTEILLKWLDDFTSFWKENWNIFDFCVTFFCFAVEIVGFVALKTENETGPSDLAKTAQAFRSVRILRSLKLMSRFKAARDVIICVTDAMKSIVFISGLLFLFGYIYAIIGVTYFDYSQSPPEIDYAFPNAFSTLGAAMKTLYQIFTNDQWINIMRDLCLFHDNDIVGPIYVSTWLALSFFVFGNTLVGIVVSHYQMRQKQLQEAEFRLRNRGQKTEDKTEYARRGSRESEAQQPIFPPEQGKSSRTEHGGRDTHIEWWTNMVESSIMDLAVEGTSFYWPRDTLLRYFVLMETLQENLHERKRLCDLANHVLNQMLEPN